MNNIESQIKNLRNEEEPYVGMPLPGLGRNMDHRMDHMDHCMDHMDHRMDHCDHMDRCDDHHKKDPLAGLPIAMAYVPWQCWGETYKPAEGWNRGTIFPELDLPFLGGGVR